MTDTYGDIKIAHLERWHQLTKNGQDESMTEYLICKWDSEIQNLAVQFPFSLVLHVGDLNFDCHRTLERKKRT